jgi:hypothetical protein
MASSFKNAHAAIGTSATTIYTCDGGLNSAVVHGLFFSNTHGAATVSVTLELVDHSATASRKILDTVPVPPNTTLSVDKPINLEPYDSIRATATSAYCDAVASVLELS